MKRLTIGALLAAAMLIPGMRAVSARQERPAPTVAYVVQAGDSLWTIAGRVDPSVDRREVVDSLMELNGMTSPAIWPGQQLHFPG